DKHYRISPQRLKKWLDERKDFLLLDTRNDYETAFGSFSGAKKLALQHFSEFAMHIPTLEKPISIKQKPIVIFCTGGIRCEKALPLLHAAGYEQIYQLEGGILNYFSQCGTAHYTGTCFVFDERIALDGELRPAKIQNHWQN